MRFTVMSFTHTGMSVRTSAGVITAHARLLLCTVDLPARATILNMKQFNGCHGCSYCEDEGTPRLSSHLHRNWLYSSTSTPRTHCSIMRNARKAVRMNDPVSKVLSMYTGQLSECIHLLTHIHASTL